MEERRDSLGGLTSRKGVDLVAYPVPVLIRHTPIVSTGIT